jgi:hypothetical protein
LADSHEPGAWASAVEIPKIGDMIQRHPLIWSPYCKDIEHQCLA